MSKDFVSPYLEEAANRAAMIGKNYNHDSKHFTFSRTQTVPGEWEDRKVPEPWSHIILGWGLMIISGVAIAVCLMGV